MGEMREQMSQLWLAMSASGALARSCAPGPAYAPARAYASGQAGAPVRAYASTRSRELICGTQTCTRDLAPSRTLASEARARACMFVFTLVVCAMLAISLGGGVAYADETSSGADALVSSEDSAAFADSASTSADSVSASADSASASASADSAASAPASVDPAAASAGSSSSSAQSPQDSEGESGEASAAVPITEEAPVEVDGEQNRIDPTQRADNSFIYDTTVDSLFSQSSLYEGKIVQVAGEVIGDIVVESPVDSKNCWITLTATDAGNPATISVLLSNEQATQIDHLGRYGVTGTTLQVRGVYHQACSEHEGLPDVHATESSVLARGSEHPDKFVLEDFAPGIVSLALGLVLMWVYYFVRERMR